jgi:ribosomal protein S25
MRFRDWSERARAATAGIKGNNAARLIAMLAARPLVLAMEMETRARISRPVAKRMLRRLADLGLTREMTGHRRFRLWTIAAQG